MNTPPRSSPPGARPASMWIEEPAWLRVRGYRLRWVLTLQRSREPSPAVLYFAGLGAGSIAEPLESAHPRDGRAALLTSFADAGFITARVEHSGVGESAGPSYAESDLEGELDAYDEALGSLFRSPFVDASRVFLFGHSLGGVLAPLLVDRRSRREPREGAGRETIAGLLVYGAPSRPWSEALSVAARRQIELSGRSAIDVEIERDRAARLYRKLFREGYDEARVRRDAPELMDSIAAADLRGSAIHGRTLDYFRSLDQADVEGAIGRLRCAVLALQGEHDWIVDPDDHARIASLCAPGVDAAACTFPGVDHDLQRHESALASFTRRGQGEVDHEVARASIAWMRRRRAPATGGR